MRETRSPWEVLGATERAKVLLLGTFHFNAEKPMDVMAAPLQREIECIVERLVAYAPTKVAVEVMPSQEGAMNADYQSYRSGGYLRRNEVHQLAFRVAAGLKHERLYAIDAPGLIWDEESHVALHRYAETHGQADLLNSPWDERYRRLYQYAGNLGLSLREMFLHMNTEEELRAQQGAYLVGRFQIGQDEEYAGPDFIAKWWYDRNLRIFARIQRITESAQDRILVIIGAGHVPILRHCVQCSPMHELVEVATYLGE